LSCWPRTEEPRGKAAQTNPAWQAGTPPSIAPCSGYHQCDGKVKVGRPSTVEELVDIVKAFPRVHGVGVGHSWNPDQFCAGHDENSVDIVMTEIKPTLDK
jgi:hypothetical protein